MSGLFGYGCDIRSGECGHQRARAVVDILALPMARGDGSRLLSIRSNDDAEQKIAFPMDPIIFLDIDGVLIAYPEGEHTPPQFTLHCVDAFKSILAAVPRIRVVLSSTWRLPQHVNQLHSQWLAYGFPVSLAWDGTPDNRANGSSFQCPTFSERQPVCRLSLQIPVGYCPEHEAAPSQASPPDPQSTPA